MKKFIIGLILGILLATAIGALADPSYISAEAVWNKIFNSSTNTIDVRAQ